MRLFLILIVTCLLSACAHRKPPTAETLVSMQMINRNGLQETISTKERLETYQRVDYLSAQPYQKILRIFGKDPEGKSPSKITSYHPNGQLFQYLEAVDGRAHGDYKEWYENGHLRLCVRVIEGPADINEIAQSAWLFEGIAKIYQENGNLEAEVPYEKGLLHGNGFYYHKDGTLAKEVPYEKNEIQGVVSIYALNGIKIETIPYNQGGKDGIAMGVYEDGSLAYEERYEADLLIKGEYFDKTAKPITHVENGSGTKVVFEDGNILSKIGILEGVIHGKVEIFDENAFLTKSYSMENGKKTGEEILYYPPKIKSTLPHPKIAFFWQDDVLHGQVKTWYESGKAESQREFCNNKKNGLSLAWYENGDMMLLEDYENDLLYKGSYFKKGNKSPVSTIGEGEGTATLYDKNGIFLKKIVYEKGKPLLHE